LLRSGNDENLNTLGDDENEQERFEPVDISVSSEDSTQNKENRFFKGSRMMLAS
jgi:hypothetical protein